MNAASQTPSPTSGLVAKARVRIGLIGCGDFSTRSHVRYLLQSPDAELAAISGCHTREELFDHKCTLGIPQAFETHQEMLATVPLDGVVISTPHMQHFPQAAAALRQGLHVLVDKPPACRTKEALELARLSRAAGAHCLVACQRRYDPLVQSILQMATRGDIGELRHIELLYARGRKPGFETSWRNDPGLSGGGALIDAGYHGLDLLASVVRRPLQSCRGVMISRGAAVETSARVALTFPNRLTADVTVDLDCPRGTIRERIAFYGTAGALIYSRTLDGRGAPRRQFLAERDGRTEQKVIPDFSELDQAPAQNLVEAIIHDETALCSISDSVATVSLIETIYQSLVSIQKI